MRPSVSSSVRPSVRPLGRDENCKNEPLPPPFIHICSERIFNLILSPSLLFFVYQYKFLYTIAQNLIETLPDTPEETNANKSQQRKQESNNDNNFASPPKNTSVRNQEAEI